MGIIGDGSAVEEMRWGGVKENDEEPLGWMGRTGLAGLAGPARLVRSPWKDEKNSISQNAAGLAKLDWPCLHGLVGGPLESEEITISPRLPGWLCRAGQMAWLFRPDWWEVFGKMRKTYRPKSPLAWLGQQAYAEVFLHREN